MTRRLTGGAKVIFQGWIFPWGKSAPDAPEGDAADVGVAGVVIKKIVSEDPAAGFGQCPHPVGQFPAESRHPKMEVKTVD